MAAETIEPERSLTRRRVVMGGALIAGSALALARAPNVVALPLPLEELQRLVPTSLGRWTFETSSGLVVPPPDESINEVYNEVLTRVYVTPLMAPIMLLIAYSNRQDGKLQLHRPEVCYPASGLPIISQRDVEVAVGPDRTVAARALTAQGRDRIERMIYWTRIGQRFPRSWLEQRIAVARDNIDGAIPDGALVRISTLEQSPSLADKLVRDFALALGQGLGTRARALIVGN